MRLRLPAPDNPLSDALLFLTYLILFLVGVFIIWVWSMVDVPWAVKAAGYIGEVFGLIGLGLLCVEHDLKLLRRALAEWRRTFRRRK